ncbi:unnamed protein product [Protopolystoma xenopodis]|uniref:Uncharacterized protein n=1 Tax=Protopolystoma xenopodis TaxID=117903 RepID=A0A3S5B8H8_9PLAT|nr:unnamed protein product [Protopolystoma xenopodis]
MGSLMSPLSKRLAECPKEHATRRMAPDVFGSNGESWALVRAKSLAKCVKGMEANKEPMACANDFRHQMVPPNTYLLQPFLKHRDRLKAGKMGIPLEFSNAQQTYCNLAPSPHREINSSLRDRASRLSERPCLAVSMLSLDGQDHYDDWQATANDLQTMGNFMHDYSLSSSLEYDELDSKPVQIHSVGPRLRTSSFTSSPSTYSWSPFMLKSANEGFVSTNNQIPIPNLCRLNKPSNFQPTMRDSMAEDVDLHTDTKSRQNECLHEKTSEEFILRPIASPINSLLRCTQRESQSPASQRLVSPDSRKTALNAPVHNEVSQVYPMVWTKCTNADNTGHHALGVTSGQIHASKAADREESFPIHFDNLANTAVTNIEPYLTTDFSDRTLQELGRIEHSNSAPDLTHEQQQQYQQDPVRRFHERYFSKLVKYITLLANWLPLPVDACLVMGEGSCHCLTLSTTSLDMVSHNISKQTSQTLTIGRQEAKGRRRRVHLCLHFACDCKRPNCLYPGHSPSTCWKFTTKYPDLWLQVCFCFIL